jgi:hypothetical protein
MPAWPEPAPVGRIAAGEMFAPLSRGGREAERLTPKKFKSSLVWRFAMIHLSIRHNKAKGGDPMSHGSAERSVLLVREMKA